MKKFDYRLWVARLFIAIIIGWNLECAIVFFLNPERYAPGFELSGIPGIAAIRGFAVLFVMWNIPYLVALWNPRLHRTSLWEALIMQFVGVLGEGLILLLIPAEHITLHHSILKFITFDALGVILLVGSVFIKLEVSDKRADRSKLRRSLKVKNRQLFSHHGRARRW